MNDTPKLDPNSLPLLRRRRVWVVILVAWTLAHYMLMYWVMDFGADEAVVSHVGFAGTIVSTVLALVAIGYAYYQTFSQRKDAEAIATQISGLQRVLAELRNSSRDIDVTAETLTHLRRNVSEMLRGQAESISAVKGVQETIKNALDAVAGPKSAPTIPVNTDFKRQVTDTLLRTPNETQLGVMLALIETARHKGKRKDFFDLIKAATVPDEADAKDAITFQGVAAGIGGTLQRLGLVSIAKDTETLVSDDFTEAVLKAIAEKPEASVNAKFVITAAGVRKAAARLWSSTSPDSPGAS